MQAEMAESLEIQPISLARLIDRLCDQKLVERRPHPSDRRANRLYLTAKGRTTLPQLVPLGREVSGEVLSSLQRSGNGCSCCEAPSHQEQHPQVAAAPTAAGGGARSRPCWLNPPGSTAHPPPQRFARLPSLRCTLSGAASRRSSASPRLVFYLFSGRYVSTDNAYIGAEKVLITPEVSGKVVRIAVVEGQLLKPGDELFAIDPGALSLGRAGGAGKAVARQQRLRRPQEQLRQPRQADRAVDARAWPRPKPTSTARRRCSSNRISTPSDLDKSRVGTGRRQGAARAASSSRRPALRNQLLGDPEPAHREISAIHRGHRGARSRQARSRQYHAARAHRRHRHAGGQHPDGPLPHRGDGRVQHHRQRQRLDRRQPQGDRPHLRAAAASRWPSRSTRFPARSGRGVGLPPSAPARARSFPSFRRRTRPATGSRSCSACPCASSSQPGQDLRRLRSGMSADGRDRHRPARQAGAPARIAARWPRIPMQ